MKRLVIASLATTAVAIGAAAVAVAQAQAPAAKAPAAAPAPMPYSGLAVGSMAPEFTGKAYIAGEAKPYSLKNELKKGPVVVYFFPAAFTGGCNLEAQEFAANIDAFKASGATVLGLTAGFGSTARATAAQGGLDEAVRDFSSQHCAGKFPVAAATPAQVAAFKAASATNPERSNRTSYVIAPNGKVVYGFTNTPPAEPAIIHISKTLTAVKAYKASSKG